MVNVRQTEFFIRFDSRVTNKRFDVFCIADAKYDFSEGLAFPDNQDGVYIFYKGGRLDLADTSCELLYCGKTVDLRTRFAEHHKKADLSKVHPLFIAVAYCNDENEIDTLEMALLNHYHFKENTKDNPGVHPTPTSLSRF